MSRKYNSLTVVFDISRTISAIGKGHPTGIDRVERTYLKHFLNSTQPILFLARFKRGSALLDKHTMRKLFKRIQNDGPWDRSGILGRIGNKKGRDLAQIRNTICRLSFSQPFFANSLKTHAPDGFVYLNVGHGRLLPSLWRKLRQSGARKIVVMVHDLIPIDFPQYSTVKSSRNFGIRMRALVQNADYFIYNSTDTARRMRYWLDKWGGNVEGRVVLLGTDPLPCVRNEPAQTSDTPHFVCLGTIEPRKNHRLLLDIWAEFHRSLPDQEIPHLHIVGKRGWMNKDVFDALDNANFMGNSVFAHGQIPDAQLGQLLRGARALLFPTFAEGFGYPLVESLQLGVPVICNDLPSFREIAGDLPTYCDIENQKEWRDKILEIAASDDTANSLAKKCPKFPNWVEHFHKIDTILGDIR